MSLIPSHMQQQQQQQSNSSPYSQRQIPAYTGSFGSLSAYGGHGGVSASDGIPRGGPGGYTSGYSSCNTVGGNYGSYAESSQPSQSILSYPHNKSNSSSNRENPAPCNTLFLTQFDGIGEEGAVINLVRSLSGAYVDHKCIIGKTGQANMLVEFTHTDAAVAAMMALQGYPGLKVFHANNPLSKKR